MPKKKKVAAEPEPIRMTDKEETKLLPCSYPGCGVPLIVNKFESAARARCPDHKGQRGSVREFKAATDVIVEAEVPPNDALHGLSCPFHPDKPMRITELIHNKKGFKRLSFDCREPDCLTYVQITPRWGPVAFPTVSKEFRELADAFNLKRGHKPVRWYFDGEDESVIDRCKRLMTEEAAREAKS